jgi:4-amino-4-deoxychorismate lyase
MCQLVESLKLKDGVIQHIGYHQNRLDSAMNELFPGAQKIDLTRIIPIPENCGSGIYKVRVLYGRSVDKIEIEPYVFRKIQSLKIVHHENIDYHLKYSDRQILNELFALRENCDDIIVVKNGLVTDSFAANLLFFDGENWLTPKTPLLKGTKRQFLLDQGIISETEIKEEEIRMYQKVGLINAIIDIEEMPVIAVENVFY